MINSKLITSALVVLLALQIAYSADLHAQSERFEVLSVVWGSYTAPAEVGPGDIGTLTVVLRTKNSVQSPTLTAYLELPKGFTSLEGGSTAMTYLRYGGSSIPAGAILELQFKVRVGDSVALGYHTAKLVLEYVVEVLYYSRTYSEETYIRIPLSGRPSISLYNYTTSTYPGQQVVNLSIINNGTTTANNVVLELSTQPLLYSNISKVEVGSLTPSTVLSIPVEVFIPPSMVNSTIMITSYLSYYGPLGVLYTNTFRNVIYVNQYEKPVLDASIDLNELLSGSSLTTNLVLANYGGLARNITVRLSTQQPLQLCSTSLYLFDTLKPRSEVSIPVKLCSIPISTHSISTLTVLVDYYDEYGASSSKSFNIPVVLRPIRDPLLTFDLISKELPSGVETQLTVSLTNIGNTYIKNVSIQPILPQNILLLTPPQLRVEALAPTNTTYAVFVIKTPYVDSLTYSRVSFQVSYSDISGNYFSTNYDFTIAIKPQEAYRALNLSLEPRRFNALSTGSLILTLTSYEDVNNLVISISSDGTPLMLSGGKDIVVSRLGVNEKYVIEVPYVVANKPGTYMLTASVKYLDFTGVSRTATYTYTFEVVPVRMLLDITLTPSSIQSGSTNTLLISVKNSGDSLIKDLTLYVNPQGTTLTIINTSKHFIGDIRPGESKDVRISLRASYVSTYTTAILSISVTYYDVLNQVYSESYPTAILVEPKAPVSALEVVLSTAELYIATTNNVTMRLRNLGSEVLEGVSYKITTGSGLNIIGGNDGYIPLLRPNESVILYLPIYVPLTNLYTSNLVVSLTYVDKSLGTLRSEDRVFTLLLRGKADLRVIDYVVMPTTVSVGQTFSVSLTLINVGVTPAYSTFVSPLLTGLPVRSLTEERTIYLGNIDVGSTTATTITLQLMNTSERMIRLPILISYLDNLRTPHNITTELIIRVGAPANMTQTVPPVASARSGGIPYTTMLMIMVAIVVAGVIIWWKFMRR
ncbi:MAG: hypothetical protein QXT01_00030 [Sulfolobales archaeon]